VTGKPPALAISEPFAAVLRSGRDHFNGLFAAARRQQPALDGEALKHFLAESADPVVRAVDRVRPERVAEVVMAAYEVGLELVGQKLAGPGARGEAIDLGWRTLLAAAPAQVAEAPLRVLTAVSNALHQLAHTPGARVAGWTEEMVRLAPACPNVEALLAVGQVCGWRSGLAHHRAGALAVADRLPPALALAAVGAAPDADWPAVRERLGRDPWHVPGDGAAAAPRVTVVGAFEGFGGVFPAPPRVKAAAGGGPLVVESGGSAWLLTADAYGATFHRATAEEARQGSAGKRLPPGIELGADGALAAGGGGARLPLPLTGEITSVAFDESTLAVTAAFSHGVAVVPLNALVAPSP
jgi:hypothetical protein